MPVTDTRWHYHADLDCGCKVRFNLSENVFLKQIEDDPEAIVVLHLYCEKCSRMGRTINLAVNTADTPCPPCAAVGKTPRTGKVAPWKP